VSPQEILFELLLTQSNAGTIETEVVADLMTFGDEPPDQSVLAPDSFRDEEERRAGAMLPQLGEDQWSGGGVRTIVERQGQNRLSSRHPVEAAGIAFRYRVHQPIGRGPDSGGSCDQQHA
jgi:hypothetical protein